MRSWRSSVARWKQCVAPQISRLPCARATISLPPSRQVKFRIGINLGDVMVQGQDLLGDGVNIAARLQTAASPGGICLSGSVHDQIRNKLSLSFQSLGEMRFKNIQQPVRTFSITEAESGGTLPSASFQASAKKAGAAK